MTDQQQADPIFTAIDRDPEDVAAALHRPHPSPIWPLLTILGIIAPLAGFVISHWSDMNWADMAAHAETMSPSMKMEPAKTAEGSVPDGTGPVSHQDAEGQNPFDAAMTKAMLNMHMAMDVSYTGNADRDFARMMIPHHQGAIDMAQLEMVYGKDARLRRLAQEIIVTQQQEIAVMQLALQQAAIVDPQSPQNDQSPQSMPGPQSITGQQSTAP